MHRRCEKTFQAVYNEIDGTPPGKQRVPGGAVRRPGAKPIPNGSERTTTMSDENNEGYPSRQTASSDTIGGARLDGNGEWEYVGGDDEDTTDERALGETIAEIADVLEDRDGDPEYEALAPIKRPTIRKSACFSRGFDRASTRKNCLPCRIALRTLSWARGCHCEEPRRTMVMPEPTVVARPSRRGSRAETAREHPGEPEEGYGPFDAESDRTVPNRPFDRLNEAIIAIRGPRGRPPSPPRLRGSSSGEDCEAGRPRSRRGTGRS